MPTTDVPTPTADRPEAPGTGWVGTPPAAVTVGHAGTAVTVRPVVAVTVFLRDRRATPGVPTWVEVYREDRVCPYDLGTVGFGPLLDTLQREWAGPEDLVVLAVAPTGALAGRLLRGG